MSKVKAIRPLGDGMDDTGAGELFDKIATFAGYGFNKSHATTYTLISYQSMWLKVNYPVEFFAAALSLMPDEKLPGLLKDAARLGIEIDMPDVNLSTDQFEILTDTRLSIPFSRVKGLSGNAALAIVEARKAGGPFASMADFVARVNRRLVHKGKVEALDKIGAFARLEPGQLPAQHPDRKRDQIELIPGLVSGTVPIARDMTKDKFTKARIVELIGEYKAKHGPGTGDGDTMPVAPVFGASAKFMVIADAPSKGEEASGRISFAQSFDPVTRALEEHGLQRADGYWTALLKRPKEGRQVSPDEIKTYLPYLEKEIALLKPPVIVLMGSTVVRQFVPDFKGKASDQAGTVIYDAKLDANLVIGFSPGEIYHDPDKQVALNDVFGVVAEMLA